MSSRIGRAAGLVAPLLALALIAAPAAAQSPAGTADYSGYATGTVVHADALQSGETRVEDTEVSFSGASVDSEGLGSRIVNEMGRVVQPASSGKRSYGRGSALEIGLGVTPEDDNQVIVAGKAERFAPPSGDDVKEIGPVPASPLAYASLLRGAAEARWAQGSCVLGADLSNGEGFAADVQLLDAGADDSTDTLDQPVLAADAPGPERAVSQSTSRTTLVPQTDRDGDLEGPDFGLMSEARMTIAPVTFFKNTDNQFTIEFAGEWVLRAVATGRSGWVHYGPGDVSPSTPILRVLDAEGESMGEVTAQQFFGEEGLIIEIPDVAEIAIGEDPRAIGGNADSTPQESATGSSGAVDVVRVRLLEQTDDLGNVTFRAAQVRVGHMEARAAAPAGGIACPGLDVSKDANPNEVAPGDTFEYSILVENPFDCTLTDVRVEDQITTTGDVEFTIGEQDPKADRVTGDSLVWNDVGPIPPHGRKKLTVQMSIDEGSGGGVMTNTAIVTADCAVGSASDDVDVKVPVEGRVTINEPTVSEVLGATLPRTGVAAPATGAALLAGATALAALRRRILP